MSFGSLQSLRERDDINTLIQERRATVGYLMLYRHPGDGFQSLAWSDPVPKGNYRFLNPAEIDRVVDVAHVIDVGWDDVKRASMAGAIVEHLARPVCRR